MLITLLILQLILQDHSRYHQPNDPRQIRICSVMVYLHLSLIVRSCQENDRRSSNSTLMVSYISIATHFRICIMERDQFESARCLCTLLGLSLSNQGALVFVFFSKHSNFLCALISTLMKTDYLIFLAASEPIA